MSHTLGAFAALVLAIASTLPAQQQAGTPGADRTAPPPGSALRVLTAQPADASLPRPSIDGNLDEAIWQRAESVTGFTQREPRPGQPSAMRTEARIAFDDATLYVAMRMYDPAPDSIRDQLTRRDARAPGSDWATVIVDSYFDRRTAFRFSTTPRGVRLDAMLSDDTAEDLTWDAVWQVATRIDADGWTAEFAIPLSQLRYSTAGDGGSSPWGLQFTREVGRSGEISHWAPLPPDVNRTVSLFGQLHGLRHATTPRRMELLPYTLGRLTRAPGAAANPFYNRSDTRTTMGADFKVGLTSSMTLTGTVNPDFGQVEADPSVVNLSAAETFYPEKRPFFTEGAEIFRFALVPEGHVFYTRRIGRAPQLGVSTPARGFADVPDDAPILGALKLSGKTAGGWSLGLMHATTRTATARVADSLGLITRQVVEPLAHYSVARLSRDFRGGGSGIGAIATSVVRDLSDPRTATLRSPALSGGANWFHRFGSNRYQTSGWVLGTSIHGSPAAIAALQRNPVHRYQRPDATHVTYDTTRRSLQGVAGDAYMDKIAGAWTWSLGAGARTPGQDVNEAGYQTWADLWYLVAIGGYRSVRPGPVLRDWRTEWMAVEAFTFGGEPTRRNLEGTVWWTFRNQMGGRLYGTHWLSAESASELRGGPGYQLPARSEGTLTLNTNRRSKVVLESVAGVLHKPEERSMRTRFAPQLLARPSTRATVTVGPSWVWNHAAVQYVRTSSVGGQPVYVMGDLRQRQLGIEGRASLVMSANLSLDVYAQPFVSIGRYGRFMEVTDPRAPRTRDRLRHFDTDRIAYDTTRRRYTVDLQGDGQPDFAFANPDFHVRQLRANAVLRWDYRPGSTLFLVWSQSRDDHTPLDEFRAWREADQLFSVAPRNVLMAKLSWWMSR
jgi:hypothetical protein